jgi:hypothetical protein
MRAPTLWIESPMSSRQAVEQQQPLSRRERRRCCGFLIRDDEQESELLSEILFLFSSCRLNLAKLRFLSLHVFIFLRYSHLREFQLRQIPKQIFSHIQIQLVSHRLLHERFAILFNALDSRKMQVSLQT